MPRKNGITGNIELVLDFFLKDAKAVNFEPSYQPTVVPSLLHGGNISFMESFEQEIVEKTNALQAYIELGEVPPQCQDLWLRNVKGTVIPTKCALYCSHGKAGLCPHYSPTTRTTVNRLADW